MKCTQKRFNKLTEGPFLLSKLYPLKKAFKMAIKIK